MDPFKKVEVGKTDLHVTRLGLGARGVVDPNVDVSDEQARATVDTSLDVGVNYIDTSPRYGVGQSELYVGQVLDNRERSSFVLSTKVGRILDSSTEGGWYWDFSAEGVRRSLESSLERLKLDYVDMLFIHSPENHFDMAISEAYPALAAMRAEGIVKAIGVGMTNCDLLLQFAQEGDFDCFLQAGRYTLLDQSANEKFLPYCQENDIGVMIGGPYNSGILASELGPDAYYDYRIASADTLEKARRIRTECQRYNVPLKAAALQFVLAHPAITSVIPGSSYPEHVHENVAMIQYGIPSDLWGDLQDNGLLEEGAPVP